ncbi:MAG: MBOAT family protein [Crocinitomicaceae bacterium]|nr:MBOAT family protein [Crocinitomicaceae bacterium]
MSWKPEFIILILFSTIVDYICAINLGKESIKVSRKLLLWTSIISNLGLLLTFKYLGFFHEVFLDLKSFFGEGANEGVIRLILPMGISFYTFQTMSYTIDVYQRKIKPEKHFGIFALFVTFFPQLVAGPIERASNLLPQFKQKKVFEYDKVTSGLRLIIWGLFKKVVIADRLAYFVNAVYENPETYDGLPLILATVFFAFQIYCDFSGYSDIAIGTARMFGFKLMENFRRPYHASSITDFWKRWHISLSTWFRDYVYIPLGGNRRVKWRWYYNLFITFVISGFWHGAKWTFLIWGAFHGVLLIIEILFKARKPPQKFGSRVLRVFLTFVLVCFGWIFFRANSLSDAIYIYQNMFTGLLQDCSDVITNRNFARSSELYMGQSMITFFIAVLSIAFMEFVHFFERKNSDFIQLKKANLFTRWLVYYSMIVIILLFGVFGTNEFIYFQF